MTPCLIHIVDYRLAAARYSPRHSPARQLTDGTKGAGDAAMEVQWMRGEFESPSYE